MRTKCSTNLSKLRSINTTTTSFAMHTIKDITTSLDEFIADGNAVCVDGLWRTQLAQYRDRLTYRELLVHFIKEYYYEYI
jgi:hypothetical protein